MGLWGVGRAFSDRSFLKILIFSTDYGRFRGGEVDLPLPGILLTPMPYHIVSVPQKSKTILNEQIFRVGVSWGFS